MRLVILLLVMGLTRIVGLRFARCERFAAEVRLFVLAVVKTVGATHLTGLLLLVIGLALTELFLRGSDQAKIMLGVLIVIFRGDRISGALRVTGQLKIFLGNVRRRSPNLHVLPVGLVHARQRILVMTTLPVTPAHTFVLTVSHGLLFRQPRFVRRHGCRRFVSL